MYEPVDNQLYPRSKDAWVGDVMPFVDDGRLELYYLYDTDHNGQAYHPIYRFSTTDLCRYQDDGQVVGCGAFDEPDLALGTGTVLLGQDGLYHCFYTGHNEMMGARGLGRECVMHAVSSDKQNWTKLPDDTFYAPPQYSTDDFRDPFVFWNEEEQCYWLLIAAREETLGGVIAKYTSQDLSSWNFCGPLYAPQSHYMLECPDLFEMGGRYYLFYSWDCVTYYAIGDSLNGPFVAPENNVLDGSGFVFYAAKTAEWKGIRYLCGWVGRTDQKKDNGSYSWAGNLLIHELVQKPDGTLGVRAPQSFDQYFTQEKPLQAVRTEGKVSLQDNVYRLDASKGEIAFIDFGMREPTLRLECDVTLQANGRAGFAFGSAEESPDQYAGLTLDAARGCIRYEGTKLTDLAAEDPVISTGFAFEAGKTYHLTLVAENEIVILYLNDTKVLSSRIHRSVDGAHMGIFADGTEAQFGNMVLTLPE